MPLEPPPTLRRTYLENSSKCLRYAHLDAEAGQSGPEARVGTAFHSVAAAVAMTCLARGETQPRPTDAEVIADRILSSATEAWDLGQERYEEVIELVRRWAPEARFLPGEAIERLFVTELEGATLTQRLDRVLIDGDAARVRDMKTGRGRPADQPTIQADVAAWHIFKAHHEIEVVNWSEEWVRFGIYPDPIELWREHTEERVERWLRTRVRLIREAYQRQQLPAKPGGHCGYCPATTSCPIPEWVRAESEVRTDDDARAQFEALLVDEARAKHRKRLLRSYIEATGMRSLVIDGEEIGFSDKPGSRLDDKAVAGAGVDLDRFRVATTPSFGRRKAR